ncbi:MAG: tetratricopeptide repeat protein [Burkholderiales bacterium]|nr:tetratricopeptide repeat protein [Burkholderiales bacterium]
MIIDRDIASANALVIDGNATSRNVLAAQLRDLGVGAVRQSARTSDARLALEHKPYDIVLCDYHFEGTDTSGQDLLDELRREGLLPHSTVFIMVTGEATYSKVLEAAEAALDGYLLKPYTAQTLGERIMEARRRKRLLRDIFEALEEQNHDQAIRLAVHRFATRDSYWQFCARLAAELMLKANRLDEARTIYQAVAEEKPMPWARLGVARVQFAKGESAQARRNIEALLRDNPEHADAYDVLGRVQVDLGDFPEALQTYRTAANLTPGCLLRLQHCGTLAFFQGENAEALRMLERTVTMGVKSKLFDALTLLLLALLRQDNGDSKGLAIVHDQLKKYTERHPESRRLQRFEKAASALRSMAARQIDDAIVKLRELVADITDERFDLEAATVVLASWTRLPEKDLPAAEFDAVARSIGMRFCVSKALTEALAASARKNEGASDLVRACQAEITAIAEQAMTHSLSGHPKRAVESLLQQGMQTRNAKLIEMAGAVTRRHADTIDGSEQLIVEASDLQRRYCQPVMHIAGVRRTGRSPGGLVLRG